MKAVRTSETSAYSNETTRRYNPNARISNILLVFNKQLMRVLTAVRYQINGECGMLWQPAAIQEREQCNGALFLVKRRRRSTGKVKQN